MREAHEQEIKLQDLAQNYHQRHYNQFLKLKLPFLYEFQELNVVAMEDRDPQFDSALLRRSRVQSSDTGEQGLYIQDNIKRTEQSESAAGSVIISSKKLPLLSDLRGSLRGQRKHKSIMPRDMTECDINVLRNYESYIKCMVNSFNTTNKQFGRVTHNRRNLEDKYNKISTSILRQMKNGQVNKSVYASQYEKMRGAIELSNEINAKEDDKNRMLEALRKSIQARVSKMNGNITIEEEAMDSESPMIIKERYNTNQEHETNELISQERLMTSPEKGVELMQSHGGYTGSDDSPCCVSKSPKYNLKTKFQLATQAFGTMTIDLTRQNCSQISGKHADIQELRLKSETVMENPIYQLLDKNMITEHLQPLGKLVKPSCISTDCHDIKAQIHSKVERLNTKLRSDINAQYGEKSLAQMTQQIRYSSINTSPRKQLDYKNNLTHALNKKRLKRKQKISVMLQRPLSRGYELMESSTFIGYDKFGNRRDKYLEEKKAQMLRPRDQLEPGEMSLGERKVVQQIRKLKKQCCHHDDSDETPREFTRMDSLVESAFNSEENYIWSKYKFHLDQPQVSERSEENHLLFEVPNEDDNIENSQSGSTFSSVYSDHEEPGESKKGINIDLESPNSVSSPCSHKTKELSKEEITQKQEFLRKKQRQQRLLFLNQERQDRDFTYFKSLNKLKLPMLLGENEKRYTISDIIEIGKEQMQIHKLAKNRKISVSTIDKISEVYQQEMNAQPFEIYSGIQISGNLYFKDFHLAPPRLNTIAITIPYILNLRNINLQNVGMKAEQTSYILQACQGLSRIQDIFLDGNELGPRAIEQLEDPNLQYRVQKFGLSNIKGNVLYKAIQKMQFYLNLNFLDLSKNHLSIRCSKEVCNLVRATRTLKTLILSDCIKNFEQGRSVIKSIFENTTIRILNLSNSVMNHKDHEFGVLLGRLVLVNKTLVHLDVSHCKLGSYDMVYFALCLMENEHIMAVHLGFNNYDEQSREVTKILLGVQQEDNILYKIKNKKKPITSLIKNNQADFQIQRQLLKRWQGSYDEYYDPQLGEWQVQDSAPDERKEVDCWICNQHNHVRIEINNLIENNDNAAEIKELSEIFKELVEPPQLSLPKNLQIISENNSEHNPPAIVKDESPVEINLDQKNHDFSDFQQGIHVVPLSKNIDFQKVKERMKSTICSPQISSVPLRNFTQNVLDQQYNTSEDPQMKSQNGIFYREIKLDHDALEYNNSSEGESDDLIQCGIENSPGYRKKSPEEKAMSLLFRPKTQQRDIRDYGGRYSHAGRAHTPYMIQNPLAKILSSEASSTIQDVASIEQEDTLNQLRPERLKNDRGQSNMSSILQGETRASTQLVSTKNNQSRTSHNYNLVMSGNQSLRQSMETKIEDPPKIHEKPAEFKNVNQIRKEVIKRSKKIIQKKSQIKVIKTSKPIFHTKKVDLKESAKDVFLKHLQFQLTFQKLKSGQDFKPDQVYMVGSFNDWLPVQMTECQKKNCSNQQDSYGQIPQGDKIDAQIRKLREQRTIDLDIENTLITSGLKVSLLDMIDTKKVEASSTLKQTDNLLARATEIYKQQIRKKKKMKQPYEDLMLKDHELPVESKFSSLKNLSNMIEMNKNQSKVNVKELRRQFATKGKIIKSPDKNNVLGQDHRLMMTPQNTKKIDSANVWGRPVFIIKDLSYQQYVKPGIHYFFLMINGKCYIDQECQHQNKSEYQPFAAQEYPGTDIKLNTINILKRTIMDFHIIQ